MPRTSWAGGSVVASNDGNWGGPANPQSWFIWRTTDGNAWQHVIGGHYPRFFDVVAASEEVAYVVGDHVVGLKTTDGGRTWRELYQEFRTDPATIATADHYGAWLMGIACAPGSESDCHAVGRSGLILHTSDGGETWQRQLAPGYGSYLYDVERTGAATGLTTGTWHYFRTGNNGASWVDAANNGGNNAGVDLAMISPNTGAMAVLKPFMRFTWDGGANWGSRLLPGDYASWFFDAADAYDANDDGSLDKVWLAGCAREPGVWVHEAPCLSGAVLRSGDGGITWADTVLPDTIPNILALDMLDDTTGWAVGDDGALAVTGDGGVTWTQIDVPADGHLHGVSAYDENQVYAVGEENVVLLRTASTAPAVSAPAQQHTSTDGDLSDWTEAAAVTIDADLANTVVGIPPDPADLSARLRLRWWEGRLFLGIEVSDDVVAAGDRVAIAIAHGGTTHTAELYADGRVSSALDLGQRCTNRQRGLPTGGGDSGG